MTTAVITTPKTLIKISFIFYIENDHEGIISRETFDKAQALRTERLENATVDTTGKKIVRSEFAQYLYSSTTKKYYRYKITNKGKRHEQIVFQSFKSDDGAGLPPIHFRQVDEIRKSLIKAMAFDVKAFRALVSDELANRIKYSDIENKLHTLELKGQQIEDKLIQVSQMEIDASAKETLRKRIEDEHSKNDTELSRIRYQYIMQYSYEKNLPLLEKKLRKINIAGENMFKYKSIVNCVIAIDRENLIFCIHLSNRNFNEIKLENEVLNEHILSGIMPFKQTRLELFTKWKLIVI